MWLIIRILVAIGAFAYKLLFRQIPRSFDRYYQDIPYSYKEEKNKQGHITKYYIEFPLSSPFICSFIPETWWERRLVAIGLGDELIIGDPHFDHEIYIIRDHPEIPRYIKERKNLQYLIRKLVGDIVTSITITGKTLRFEVDRNVPLDSAIKFFVEVLDHFRDVSKTVRSRFYDSFYIKALIAESIVWAIVWNAGATVLEWTIFKEDYHLFPRSLLLPGGVIAIFLASFSAFCLALFLGGSSRAPRIIIDSYVMLMIALPIIGVEVISDLNRNLDTDPGIEIERVVERAERRVHRRRRSTSYSYHLYFSSKDSEIYKFTLPTHMEVDIVTFNSASASHRVRLRVSQGFLGYPWYRDMK